MWPDPGKVDALWHRKLGLHSCLGLLILPPILRNLFHSHPSVAPIFTGRAGSEPQQLRRYTGTLHRGYDTHTHTQRHTRAPARAHASMVWLLPCVRAPCRLVSQGHRISPLPHIMSCASRDTKLYHKRFNKSEGRRADPFSAIPSSIWPSPDEISGTGR